MAANNCLSRILFAVVGGGVIGITVGLSADAFGVSDNLVAPLAGGITGAFVPLIYRLGSQSAPAGGDDSSAER